MSKLDWRGDEVLNLVAEATVDGVTELGLRWETQAKGSIYPGRGVVTGTYRRSLHSANPNYDFGGDDVQPSPSSPERGGRGGGAVREGSKVSLRIGSGLRYARKLESMYNVVRGAFEQVAPKLPDLIAKHAKKRGLK